MLNIGATIHKKGAKQALGELGFTMDEITLRHHFNYTIDSWVQDLEKYSLSQLLAKPSATGWSVGQVYMHVIEATSWFLGQVMICAATNGNCKQCSLPAAKKMFLNNEFPDAILEGPPENSLTPQPTGRHEILKGLAALQIEIGTVTGLLAASPFKGKTKHPGLGWFSGGEWFLFAEMHCRHHERQLKRLDAFLRENNIR